MFEKLKRALRPTDSVDEGGDGLARWAVNHMLSHHRLASGGTVAEGVLLDRPFQTGCAPSSRFYIVGNELMAKAGLGLREDVNIVVMHRTLKRALEQAAIDAYEDSVNHVRTTDKPLPEELVWLSLYRDAGWPGPEAGFWARFSVLTDNVVAARDWLDEDAVQSLCEAPVELRSDIPFLVALTRGKVYLRMQLEGTDDGMVSHHALDIMEQLSARALRLFGR
jgi:hypothetical protein